VRVVIVYPAWGKIKCNGRLSLAHSTCYRGPISLVLTTLFLW